MPPADAATPDAPRVLDPAFARLLLPRARVERLAQGCAWAEGPVWFGDHRCLLWSDIPGDRILRWDEATGAVTPFRRPSFGANGNARDLRGRLVTCEHRARQVTRTEPDGAVTVLCDRFEGRRLNSPNDVAVHPDGGVWFTDPPYGLPGDDGGAGPQPGQELPTDVYRIDPATGAVARVAEGVARPNGLCFAPGGRRLHLVESGARPRAILVADVVRDGAGLGRPRVLARCPEGESPDGLRCDAEGNLWCGWGGPGADGVRVLAPDGRPVLHVPLPERCANLCFGGRHGNRLFLAATTSLYAFYVNVAGA